MDELTLTDEQLRLAHTELKTQYNKLLSAVGNPAGIGNAAVIRKALTESEKQYRELFNLIHYPCGLRL